MKQLLQMDSGKLKRPYVPLMMDVIGRALEAASQVDEGIQKEVKRLPPDFSFEMRALPSGPAVVMQKRGEGQLHYVGSSRAEPVDVSLKFKHSDCLRLSDIENLCFARGVLSKII